MKENNFYVHKKTGVILYCIEKENNFIVGRYLQPRKVGLELTEDIFIVEELEYREWEVYESDV